MNNESISKATGLSIEEIRKLRPDEKTLINFTITTNSSEAIKFFNNNEFSTDLKWTVVKGRLAKGGQVVSASTQFAFL